jgi:hypothetical protein
VSDLGFPIVHEVGKAIRQMDGKPTLESLDDQSLDLAEEAWSYITAAPIHSGAVDLFLAVPGNKKTARSFCG